MKDLFPGMLELLQDFGSPYREIHSPFFRSIFRSDSPPAPEVAGNNAESSPLEGSAASLPPISQR